MKVGLFGSEYEAWYGGANTSGFKVSELDTLCQETPCENKKTVSPVI